MNFCIAIGGISAELCHRYAYITHLCKEYMTELPPAFSVSVTDAEIEAEIAQNNGAFGAEICEATCLHRALAMKLMSYGMFLIHSAAIAVDGEAYLFLAKSGVGKSTHVALWMQAFGDRVEVVNGDKPMLSFVGDTLMVHGTPWRGKEGLGAPVSRSVKGICLLERGEVNRIFPATEKEAVERIFHQVLLPKEPVALAAVMQFLDRVLKTVPLYRLQCNKESEAAFVSYEGMRKGKI